MLHSRTLALVAIVALFTMPPLASAGEAAVVTATGEGRVEVAPDLAWLGFGISARQPTVAEARDEVARGVARLIALARDTGLKDDHIATAALSVSPEFDWHPETRERRLLGYIVTRQVTLKLTDLAKLGELTEKALGLGVTEASPAAFDTSRRAELEAEARASRAGDGDGRSARRQHRRPRADRRPWGRFGAAPHDAGDGGRGGRLDGRRGDLSARADPDHGPGHRSLRTGHQVISTLPRGRDRA